MDVLSLRFKIQSPVYKEAKNHKGQKDFFINSPKSLILQCRSSLKNLRKHFMLKR
jgi:hypothetical protein